MDGVGKNPLLPNKEYSIVDEFLKQTYRIIEATSPAEYNNLSDANKERYKIIVSAGTIDFREDSLVRTVLWNMFDDNSTTRTNLKELIPEPPEEEE